MEIKNITTEEEAIEHLNQYTGLYYNLAFAQYKLSRQQGQTINESLNTVAEKIIETTTQVIDRK